LETTGFGACLGTTKPKLIFICRSIVGELSTCLQQRLAYKAFCNQMAHFSRKALVNWGQNLLIMTDA
jgi:hypothetical protein